MSFRRSFLSFLLITATALSLLTACADVPKSSAAKAAKTNYSADVDTAHDPYEGINRVTFDVNDFLDRLLFRPLAELYRATVPPGIRDRVGGIITNMREPVIFANNLLQGEVTRAGYTFERFALNTTAGVGGMWDIAGMWRGVYQQSGDFGQTLASWGVGSGPYIVLPFYGPSNIRDAIGLGVDGVMTPWSYVAGAAGANHIERNQLNIIFFTSDGIVRREQNIEALDALKSGSLDFYAQMRSVYRQYRAKQLGNQSTEGMPKFDDYQ
jgi:phospholipid-binding lipoprotein MlaA